MFRKCVSDKRNNITTRTVSQTFVGIDKVKVPLMFSLTIYDINGYIPEPFMTMKIKMDATQSSSSNFRNIYLNHFK